MPARVHPGADRRGGVIGYPLDQLHEEVAFLAYHVHWPREELLSLDHGERRRWVQEISLINQKMNEA